MSLVVDNFAGGGGASTGIEQALGRAVDIAINHDEQAIRMHEVNHPTTKHIRNNIWQVDPREVTGGQPVSLAWLSPDCKHFSKAKGGKPREKSIRDLAWVVVLWAQRVKPALILLENVEEFRTWGPLCEAGMPIKARAGETFDQWCKALRKAGYKLQFRELRACDYGAPTIRKRFFMIARCDGKPIVWPEPTHGKPGSAEVLSGKRLPWRTAAEIIDWSIPCPSIFERKKPLADKTLRRIAHGIMKFVVNNPRPFIVPMRFNNRATGTDEPVQTATTQGNAFNLVVPHVTKFRNSAIGHAIDEPLATGTANSFIKRPGGSAPLGVVHARLEKNSTGRPESTGQEPGSTDTTERLRLARTQRETADTSEQAEAPAGCDGPVETLSAAHLVHIGNGEREGQTPRAMDAEKPLGTVVGSTKHAVVAAFLERQFGKSMGAAVDQPMPTTTAGGGGKTAIVCAHIEQANGGPNNETLAGRAADDPLSTIQTKGSQQRLVTSNLIKLRGGEASHDASSSISVEEPLHTICATGTHMAEVRAFLIKYYGNEQDGHGLDNPIGTVTVQDRFGVVTVQIEGEEYVIVDIGMRMLTPRELFNAQGFPPDYIIDRDARGNPITKTAQVAKCGNSVCPPLSRALVAANHPEAITLGAAVAA